MDFHYLKALADLAMPRICPVCGRILGTRENHLCIYCAADFPFTYFWMNPRNRMADKFNEAICSEAERTGKFEFEPYSYAAALFYYSSGTGYRHITQRLKYHGDRKIGKYFSRILGELIFGTDTFGSVDLIVPVPLHPARKFTRGYNQAEIIAAELGKVSGAAVASRLLARKKYTETQTVLTKEEKMANVESAFRTDEKYAGRLNPHHILITDDVFTTGATALACHKVLRRTFGNSVRISVATLACVGSI